MNRKILVILIFFVLGVSSFSQTAHSVTLGPDLGIPTKRLGANVSLGGSLEYQLKFSAPVAIQLHAGYNRFTNKVYSDQKVSFLPVRLGLVGFIYEDIFFVSADAGISHYYSPTSGTKQDGFTFGAGAGYRYPIGEGQILQISGYYNLHNFKRAQTSQNYNYNWFNIRAAYGLSWGKGNKKKE